MSTPSRPVFAGFLVITAIVGTGCFGGKPPPIQLRSPAVPSAGQQPAEAGHPGNPKVDQMDARAGTIDALTWKTEAYTRELGPMLASRSTPPQAPQLPARESTVEWIDPPVLTLGNSTGRTTQGRVDQGQKEIVKQAISAAPLSTNQGGSAANEAPARLEAPSRAAPETAVAMPGSQTPTAMRTSQVTTDILAEKLSRRVKDYPRDVSGQLEYQLLQFLRDDAAPQMSTLSGLPPEDREMVTVLLDGLTNFRNALRADSNMLLSSKIKPLLEMSERLRNQADLTIPTIALCKKVAGYGSYDPIDPARFAAGKDEQVIVYCEVANFTSNLNSKQLLETRLTWDMTLYAEGGLAVWSDKTETIKDEARNRRHDFYVVKMITLPHTLPIGRYLMKVSIIDTQSNRVAEATAPLVIAAQ